VITKEYMWLVPIRMMSLYNKVVMVLLHIMSAYVLFVGSSNSVGRCICQQLSVSRQMSPFSKTNLAYKSFLKPLRCTFSALAWILNT
jgi:hypothetical protein